MTQDRTPGGQIQREGDWGQGAGDQRPRQESRRTGSSAGYDDIATDPVSAGTMTPAEARAHGARIDRANENQVINARVERVRQEDRTIPEAIASLAVTSITGVGNDLAEAQALHAAVGAYKMNETGTLNRLVSENGIINGSLAMLNQNDRMDSRANAAIEAIREKLGNNNVRFDRQDVEEIRAVAQQFVTDIRENGRGERE